MRIARSEFHPGRSRLVSLSAFSLLSLLVLWACQLSQNTKVEDTANFDKLYDSLSRYDSVVIVFNDAQGSLLDTVFKGKVDSHSKIRNLEVKGWDGGKAQIQIFGFDAGQLVYQVDKKFDGTTDQTDANVIVMVPDAAIHADIHDLQMAEGDSLKYPAITVSPAALSDKSVIWASSNPDVLAAGPGLIRALKAGSAVLKAQLKVSPAIQMTINVTVSAKPDTGVVTGPDTTKVDSLKVAILSPPDHSYTNQTAITVKWTVDGQLQDTLPKENLMPGANTVTRTAKNGSGKQGSASIVVYLDTLKPLAPIVTGPASTGQPPVWRWATGGGGGSGDYRVKLGDADFSQGATQGRDTSFTLKDGLVSGTTYTLFVAERDQAGNWSDAAKLAIKYDLTKPIVTLASPAFTGGTLYTNAATMNLAGTVAGPAPISSLAYAIGSGPATPITLSSGAWTLTGIAVTEGVPVNVTLTATDAVGNTGSLMVPILMDNTPPSAPAFVITPTTPTKAISGSWTWTAGADGAAGSGLNGHFRYALNNGAWKDTTGLSVGSLVLSEGNNVLALQEQDRSGLWSASATSLVKVDLTAPGLSILSHSNPATLTTTHITFTVSASDSGSGVQSVMVAGQTAGSGVLTNSGGIWTSSDLALKGGANSLVVTANDQVGNSRSIAFTVNVNVPASAVVITDPPANTITNADSIDVSYTIDGTPGKKRFGLAEGPNALTVASPPNASGVVGKDSVNVIRDATAPKAPTLAINASNTNGTATWTWTSNGDNAGGVGAKSPPAFRYSFNGGTTWMATSYTSTTQTAEGVYTLIVQEQDKAGNWSASSAAKSISVDKTPPVVTIQTPDNYITNKGSVTISYTEQDSGKSPVSKTKAVSLPTDNGANTVTISSVADAAGNVGTASITVYRRSNVVFVKTAASGSGDGSSWDNAAGGLESGIAKSGSGGQIWLAAGTYKTPSASGFAINKSTRIYGGFDANGVAFKESQRDSTLPNKTILAASNSGDTILNVNRVWTDPPTYLSDFGLNGVQVSGLGTVQGAYGIVIINTSRFEIRNCVFQQLSQNALYSAYSQGLIYGCMFQYNSVVMQVVNITLMESDNIGITFQQCVFQHNAFNLGAGPLMYQIVYFFDGGRLTFDTCSFLDALPASDSNRFYQLASNAPYADAVVTFKNSTITGGLSSIYHLGTLNYTGLGNTPP